MLKKCLSKNHDKLARLNDFKNELPGQNFYSDWSFVAEAKCPERVFAGHTQ
jgi:hypothetical protein